MSFTITATDPASKARCGLLRTAHGEVETPVFMPVATQGSVKALSQEDLGALGVRAILSNAYHLNLRPGPELIRKAGGLHKFMGYDGMILTDSGGFQVMSLAEMRKLDEDGAEFRSHIDGSLIRLTPEKVVDIQAALGSDCWTVLDECPPYPCSEAEAEKALLRTQRWAERSVPVFKRHKDAGAKSLFFPILQGSLYPALRRRAAEHMAGLSPDGICLGGFSVGEPKELTWEVVDASVEALPSDKPRYLMGVGTPEDLWDAVACGVDMLDCVFPTRVARNGLALTSRGRLNITLSAMKEDFSPLDSSCACFVCRRYTRAYLAHLHRAKELSVYRYLTYHNVHFMLSVVADIRGAIRAGRFRAAREEFRQVLTRSA